MKRFFFFLLLSLMASSQVMACRCSNPGPKNAYGHADAVVLVKIRTVTKAREDVVQMETEVSQSWKSKVVEDTNILAVFSRTTECPYVGQEGETYLLYLDRFAGPPEGFWTDSCMGNLPKSHAQTVKHIQWLNRNGKKT